MVEEFCDAANSGLATLLLAAAAGALLGCGSPDRAGSPDARPEGTPMEIAAEPRLEVGEGAVGGDSLEMFQDVRRPFLMDDGRLVVPDGGSVTLRIFDAGGAHDRTLGGAGQGPGEFSRLDDAWHRGDTIEAWDSRLGRFTRFFPGDSVEVVRFEGGAGPRQVVRGSVSGGWVVTEIESAGMGQRDRMTVSRVGPDGADRGVIARTRGMARLRTSFVGGPDPLSPRAQMDVANGEVYVAETLTPEIRVLSPSGDSLRTITWEPESRPSPEEALRRTIEAALAARSPEDTAGLRKRFRAFPLRDRVSAFWSFLVDERGFVWVQRYDPGRHSIQLGGVLAAGRGGEWVVFSTDGRRLTSLRMPDGFRPTEITDDAVVGVSRNEVGAEIVRVYPLDRR